MKINKVLIISILTLSLISCVTKEDVKPISQNITNNNKKVEVKKEVKNDGIDFVQWECYKFDLVYKYQKHLLNIGYFPNINEFLPNSDINLGMLLLKDTNTVVPIFYTLMGVKHTFTWGNIDKKNGTKFTINIDTDGTGYFFDFTGVEVNESVKSSQRYECKPPKTVTVGKDNFLEWVETLKETFIKLK